MVILVDLCNKKYISMNDIIWCSIVVYCTKVNIKTYTRRMYYGYCPDTHCGFFEILQRRG